MSILALLAANGLIKGIENLTQEIAEDSSLTKRESDVLALIAVGSSAPEVANTLKISKYTVEGHLKQGYRKLGISSRAEAALAARKQELV